ncbi:hypothetical protein BG844_02595 [Couchioplanes caeruleus subsp. caeruleus]|uniref:TY-Chap N-terminal domain-containing protein n=1 Tax=Couchioplanes caeruleus subsp. caeruleus TaxID=56427 RepID=A0A1K0GTM3_9ACTN|nr:hypothetical protein BG844_02595 [Couchioplanes caeruleus subsp. caeruleus]
MTQDLGRRLPLLPVGDIVILQSGAHYTQVHRDTDELDVEAVSNHHLPAHQQLSAAQQEQLAAAGWTRPAPPATYNWWIRQPAPFSTRDGLRLAERMVAALRDVYGIVSPDTLVEQTDNILD